MVTFLYVDEKEESDEPSENQGVQRQVKTVSDVVVTMLPQVAATRRMNFAVAVCCFFVFVLCFFVVLL